MDDKTPKTPGIAPAQSGSLAVLQFTRMADTPHETDAEEIRKIFEAAHQISTYQPASPSQVAHYKEIAAASAALLGIIVLHAPPGPFRSTAISRAQEARMWANAAIALEGK